MIEGFFYSIIMEHTDNNQEWTRQRSELLYAHIKEWKEHAIKYQKARQSLMTEYGVKKTYLEYKKDRIEWSSIIIWRSLKLVELTNENTLIEAAMKMRHKQEQGELEERIKRSSLRSGC